MEAFRVKFSGVRGTNMVTVQPSGVSGGFYAAAPERQPHVTRCVSCSVRAPISRQSRKLASLGQCALMITV